jgi:type I restriction enzyme S subunit
VSASPAKGAQKTEAGEIREENHQSVQAYPDYKDSGVEWIGPIPAHWGVKRAKYLFTLAKRPVSDDDGIVTAFRDGRVTLRSNRRTDGFTNAVKEIGYQGVRKGDLVIHAMDAFAGAVGVSESDGKCSPVYSCCIPGDQSDSKFYARLVRTMATTGFIESLAKGIRERSTDFRWGDFYVQYLPHPPLSEQVAIRGYLSRETARIDNLIAEKQNFINLLKEKRQALISHVVTKGLDPTVKMKDSGIEWLGEVPERWVKTRLKFHVTNIIDTEHKTIPFVDESAYLVVRTSDIREGELLSAQCRRTDPDSFEEWTRRGVPSAGDVILTREAPAGEACIVPDGLNVCLGQRTVLIRTSQSLLSEYLVLVIYSDITKTFIDNASMGSTVKHLNMADIPNIPLFLPDLETQAAIVEFTKQELGKIDQIRTETLSSLELLNEHRTALISAAVTGKIDVRNY